MMTQESYIIINNLLLEHAEKNGLTTYNNFKKGEILWVDGMV